MEFTANKREIERLAENKKNKSDKKQGKIDDASKEKLLKVKMDLQKRGLFPCSHLSCAKVCHSMTQLAKHISKDVHTATTSTVISNAKRVMIDATAFKGRETLSDIVASMCLDESMSYARVIGTGVSVLSLPSVVKSSNFSILESHFHPAHIVNIQDRETGYAKKHSSRRFPITAEMLRFVLFCYKRGKQEKSTLLYLMKDYSQTWIPFF